MLTEAAKFKKDWQKRQRKAIEAGVDCAYLYVHSEADSGEPFYVGMGETRTRPWDGGRSDKHINRANKHGQITHVDAAPTLTYYNALWWEVRWIKAFRDAGYDLVNLTDGGDGVKGLVHSEESKELMSAKQIVAQNTEKTRQKRQETNTKPEVIQLKSEIQKEAQNRPDVVQAKSVAMSGDNSPMKRPEVKAKHKANTPRGDKHYMKTEEARASRRGSNNVMAREDVRETQKQNVPRGDDHHTRKPGSAEKHKAAMNNPELITRKKITKKAWWDSKSKEERDEIIRKGHETRRRNKLLKEGIV